jgi:SAM-dependent methyltransferase
MSRYYPPEYYSFSSDFSRTSPEQMKAKAQFMINTYLSGMDVSDSRILDVGCGSGSYVYALKELGVKQVLGVDPYIQQTIEYDNSATVRKDTIYGIDQQWDLIMFNHSFEHLSDPAQTLRKVSGLLSEGGVCMIRIPTVSSYAWEHYGVDWVQLDAPRHFFLYSVESMNMLAEASGLALTHILYDSTAFQFYGSELYKRDIPLFASDAIPASSVFSQSQMEMFETISQQLNEQNRGDQAAFYLRQGAGFSHP